MPELRPDDIPLTREENAVVRAEIVADPDTFEADEEWFKRARPAAEVEPKFVERWRQNRSDEVRVRGVETPPTGD